MLYFCLKTVPASKWRGVRAALKNKKSKSYTNPSERGAFSFIREVIYMTVKKLLNIMFYDEDRGWVVDTLEVEEEVDTKTQARASASSDRE